MLKKLNTNYKDFINESLFVDSTVNVILQEMSKYNELASLIFFLTNNSDYYDTKNQINFISLSNNINMLKYPYKHDYPNKNSNEVYNSTRQIEVRVGRLIKRIIQNINKEKFKFECDLNANFVNRPLQKKTDILISKKISGTEFLKKYDESGFRINDGFFSNSIKIYKNGRLDIESEITSSTNRIRRCHWDNSIDVYFEITTDKIDLSGIHNIKIEIEKTFANGKKIDQINDSDIEQFSNEMIAFIKLNKSPENAKIEIIKGKEIKYWYNSNNYQSDIGQLGSSCMSNDGCQGYFDIYTDNTENISLMILKNENGKLVGRSLLWKTIDNKYFMDRVYCLTEIDEKIFTKHAIDNGYYYRNNGNNNNIQYFFDGKPITDDLELSVKIEHQDFSEYPYIDTLCYLDIYKFILHNGVSSKYSQDREFRDTEGKWTEWHEENGNEYDDY